MYVYTMHTFIVKLVTMYNNRIRTQIFDRSLETQTMSILISTTHFGIVTELVRLTISHIKAG